MADPQFGDFQLDIYRAGTRGEVPRYPVDFASLEKQAKEVMPWWIYNYVAGGCGDEFTPSRLSNRRCRRTDRPK